MKYYLLQKREELEFKGELVTPKKGNENPPGAVTSAGGIPILSGQPRRMGLSRRANINSLHKI